MFQDTLQSKVFILIINDTGSMFIEDFKGDVGYRKSLHKDQDKISKSMVKLPSTTVNKANSADCIR